MSADMADRPDNRAEEAKFLADMPGVLGAKAMAGLGQGQAVRGSVNGQTPTQPHAKRNPKQRATQLARTGKKNSSAALIYHSLRSAVR
jgi:hypothetical protein